MHYWCRQTKPERKIFEFKFEFKKKQKTKISNNWPFKKHEKIERIPLFTRKKTELTKRMIIWCKLPFRNAQENKKEQNHAKKEEKAMKKGQSAKTNKKKKHEKTDAKTRNKKRELEIVMFWNYVNFLQTYSTEQQLH